MSDDVILSVTASQARRILTGEIDAYSQMVFSKAVLDSGYSAEQLGITRNELQRIRVFSGEKREKEITPHASLHDPLCASFVGCPGLNPAEIVWMARGKSSDII